MIETTKMTNTSSDNNHNNNNCSNTMTITTESTATNKEEQPKDEEAGAVVPTDHHENDPTDGCNNDTDENGQRILVENRFSRVDKRGSKYSMYYVDVPLEQAEDDPTEHHEQGRSSAFSRRSTVRISNEDVRDYYGGKVCCFGGFGNHKTARGYNILGTAKGPMIMSNVFLSTALIYLASEEVGCIEPDPDNPDEMQLTEECDERVYGMFRPAALVSNIAVISGVLSALFMPVIGAVIDYTDHRWLVGVVASVLMTVIQLIQIGINSNTWFVMAILQAITGFFFEIFLLASFAYLPEIRRTVSTATMTRFSSTFSMIQSGSQALFLLLIVGLGMGLSLNDVETARVSQGINSINVLVSFALGWRLIPAVPARRACPKDQSVVWKGLQQNWNTVKRIQKHYKRSIRWYLLGVLFAEPAANAFTTVSVVFLSDKLGLSSTELGVFFLVVLVSLIPGGMLAQYATRRTDVTVSYRFSMGWLFVLSVVGGLTLTPGNVVPFGYIWAVAIGIGLGSFYPTENLYMSMICPQGIEAEMSGLVLYAGSLLVWLPPLLFSGLVEANVDQKWGLIVVSGFFVVAIGLISMSASFDDILEEVRINDLSFILDYNEHGDPTNTNHNHNNNNDKSHSIMAADKELGEPEEVEAPKDDANNANNNKTP